MGGRYLDAAPLIVYNTKQLCAWRIIALCDSQMVASVLIAVSIDQRIGSDANAASATAVHESKGGRKENFFMYALWKVINLSLIRSRLPIAPWYLIQHVRKHS